MFTQLQVRSAYSLLQSTIKIESLVSHAVTLNQSAVALVEKGSLHSCIKFYEACMAANIKPIIGLSVVVEIELNLQHVSLIAKNYQGYQALLQCATDMAMNQKVAYERLKEHQENLVIILEPEDCYLTQLLQRQEFEQAKQYYTQHLSGFTHFYMGLSKVTVELTQQVADCLPILKQLNIPVVALNETCYLNPTDAKTLQHLQLIDQGLTIDSLNTDDTQRYYKSEAMMNQLFSDCIEAVEAISDISSLCQLEIPLHQSLLPKFPTPPNVSSQDYLKALCYKGIQKRYEGRLTNEHIKRLEYELSVIERMGFEDYFLIVWDFVKYAKQQKINVGCGRGSAAGSIVSYVLGITNVDPIKYELLFERFLNPERLTLPDIDIDFQDTRRDEVIAYVQQKYGVQHVIHILTFGTFQPKSAWRDVARIYGVDAKLVNRVASQIVTGVTLAVGYAQNDKLQQLFDQYPKLYDIYQQAEKIEGLPRHTSIHAAGIIISNQVLTNYTALMPGPSDVYLSQFEAGDLEKIGLLKMDFLGLKNLSMLTQIESLIKKDDQTFSINQIPFHDQKTFELISKGQTTGVFQLESEGMKQALKLIRPTHLEDIIASNALFRPGPMENIPLFARRKHQQESISYYHEDLKPILQKTYGIIIYQEQIMQIAHVICGYTLAEADVLRRAVSKKSLTVLEKEREHFVTKAVERGYANQLAVQLYELILKFANYGFNRSHAVAYSMIAYQMAYLKAHYPVYFMTVALTHSVGSETTTALYVKEARQLGIEILGPSVLSSEAGYKIESQCIRFGLLPIKNIGINLISQLVKERSQKPFESYFDFVSRCRNFLNIRSFECLIDSGACDEFKLNRETLHKNLHAIIDFSKFNGGLFFNEFEVKYCDEVEDFQEKMKKEKELLGFYLNSHPMKNMQKVASQNGWIFPSDIKTSTLSTVKCIGYVERIKEIRDKKGRLMCFCDFSDEMTSLSVTIFADQYKSEYKSLLGKIIVIEGRISSKKFEKSLNFSKLIAIT